LTRDARRASEASEMMQGRKREWRDWDGRTQVLTLDV